MRYFTGKSFQKQANTAIVAGHYMLMYHSDSDSLVSMVHQDNYSKRAVEHSKNLAGNFPVHSLQYGLELYDHINKTSNCGIILLVDDHKFQSPSFQPFDREFIKGRGGSLRKAYYRKPDMLPSTYINMIEGMGGDLNEILINNNSNRKKDEILPSECYCYSEQVLRNKFDKRTKPKLLENKHFYESVSDDVINLYYIPDHNSETICLSEEGKCGCSGEVIQFFLELSDRGYDEIIFIIPFECNAPVDSGSHAALEILASRGVTSFKLTTIHGYGFHDFSEIENNDNIFYVREYSIQ